MFICFLFVFVVGGGSSVWFVLVLVVLSVFHIIINVHELTLSPILPQLSLNLFFAG